MIGAVSGYTSISSFGQFSASGTTTSSTTQVAALERQIAALEKELEAVLKDAKTPEDQQRALSLSQQIAALESLIAQLTADQNPNTLEADTTTGGSGTTSSTLGVHIDVYAAPESASIP
jgi:chromosome segregation ATPase